MEPTIFPTPDDLGRAWIWDSYVITQTVAASRGQVPEHALAVGVGVEVSLSRIR